MSHRVPTEPHRTHYTHISHRNLLKAESNMCAYTHTGAAHVLHCEVPVQFFVCFSSSINAPKLIPFLSLEHVLVGVCSQSALAQTRQRSQTTMLRGACYSKWPNGKTKGLTCAWVCMHMHVCLCAFALGGCGPVGEGRRCCCGEDMGSSPLQWEP